MPAPRISLSPHLVVAIEFLGFGGDRRSCSVFAQAPSAFVRVRPETIKGLEPAP
jgi:hypothetical protein